MSRPVTGRHQPHPENVCASGRRRACGLSYSQYHAHQRDPSSLSLVRDDSPLMDPRLHGDDKFITLCALAALREARCVRAASCTLSNS